MAKKISSIVKFTILSASLFLSGCGPMITEVVGRTVVSGFPTFQQVSMDWPETEEGYGRIVIYYPPQGMMASVHLSIDGDMETDVLSRTFVFADLAEGNHIIAFKAAGIFGESATLEIEVTADEVNYAEVHKGMTSSLPPRIVGEKEALKALEQLHHSYREPLPFHDPSERAVW